MIFIADSGSTKTQWRLLDADGSIQQAKTAGYNPHHQTAAEIRENLQEEFLPQLPAGLQPQSIHFYGAGCSSDKSKAIVRMAFREVFPEADITIEHDLLAAARALCGDEPGIACIIGTGSNSCLYNGSEITHNIPALGWILGDEGSGSDLGRRLVADFLRFNMPDHLRKAFIDAYGQLSSEEVMDRIYRQPFPKPYIASFARFLHTHLQDPWCYRHMYDSFRSFLEKNVCKYPDYQQHKLHFVGSVAYHNSDVLRKAATDLGLRVHHVLESPIAGLTLYHQKAG
jgi:glucosamine kinase